MIDEIVEILADGLRRHLEAPGKVFHHHPAEGAGDVQDLGLAMAQAGHDGTSRKTGGMVLRFCDGVNEGDWLTWSSPRQAGTHSRRCW